MSIPFSRVRRPARGRTGLRAEELEAREVPASLAVSPGPPTAGAGAAQLLASYGQVPLSFEANRGQTDPRVKFLARGGGYGLFLTATDAVLSLASPAAGGQGNVVAVQLVGARAAPAVV